MKHIKTYWDKFYDVNSAIFVMYKEEYTNKWWISVDIFLESINNYNATLRNPTESLIISYSGGSTFDYTCRNCDTKLHTCKCKDMMQIVANFINTYNAQDGNWNAVIDRVGYYITKGNVNEE